MKVARLKLVALRGYSNPHFARGNAYEKGVCKHLGWTRCNEACYDAVHGETRVEFKKGNTHFWLNALTLARHFPGIKAMAAPSDFMLFIRVPKGKKEVYGYCLIPTPKLLEWLGIDKDRAKELADFNAAIRERKHVKAFDPHIRIQWTDLIAFGKEWDFQFWSD